MNRNKKSDTLALFRSVVLGGEYFTIGGWGSKQDTLYAICHSEFSTLEAYSPGTYVANSFYITGVVLQQLERASGFDHDLYNTLRRFGLTAKAAFMASLICL